MAQTATQTTTTTIQYDADGAPTAVTIQVDAQPATTVYLTWDNFTPNAAAPSTGTVSAANGNLIGIGPTPGTNPTQQFGYDARDRLVSCQPSNQAAISYAYHPNSQMASTALAGDTLQFYYDETRPPRMANVSQSSTSLSSSFLGPVRYLSDGTEQVLLNPRKDTAGVYDADAQTVVPYSYDPYGAPTDDTSSVADGYDLADNPYQYAGAYLDSVCSAYYLNARWYLAHLATFISRDPADQLHRYSYTAGDPIGRTDPSGLKSGAAAFSGDIAHLVHRLTPGVWAYVEPVMPVWGQALGGIELLGDLAGFWHHRSWQSGLELSFLGSAVAAEAIGELPWFDGAFSSPTSALWARRGIDLALGGGQTFVQADNHGRFDPPALIQGIETTFAGVAWGREIGGVGYRPYGLDVDDVDRMTAQYYTQHGSAGNSLIFRIRYEDATTFTSPVMETLHIGFYHEALLAVSSDEIATADVGIRDGRYTWNTRWSRSERDVSTPSAYLGSRSEKSFIFAGTVRQDAADEALFAEMDRSHVRQFNREEKGRIVAPMNRPYGKFTNNCQQNAARVRANMLEFQRRRMAAN
ncbi:MAG: RHS repeat-associated core domain-containing protein [Deltaproteobacteria bacterium]|nr:RHS repeat-associated core domain-containing protein [Deltaproteobacteria bacterium]